MQCVGAGRRADWSCDRILVEQEVEVHFFGLFVLLVQDLHQVLGHVVGFLSAAVIPLQILQEAEEECVHTHAVDAEERARNEIRTKHYRDDGHPVVVE